MLIFIVNVPPSYQCSQAVLFSKTPYGREDNKMVSFLLGKLHFFFFKNLCLSPGLFITECCPAMLVHLYIRLTQNSSPYSTWVFSKGYGCPLFFITGRWDARGPSYMRPQVPSLIHIRERDVFGVQGSLPPHQGDRSHRYISWHHHNCLSFCCT